MGARVSFIIPVLNEQATVASLLCDLRRRYGLSEIIVVDGGSADSTVEIAMPLCDQLLLGERGRGQQMNLGQASPQCRNVPVQTIQPRG